MPTIKHRPFPGTAADDDDVLRRLGAAIAIHWKTIDSEALQFCLVEQAVMMGDSDGDNSAADLRNRIKTLINENRE